MVRQQFGEPGAKTLVRLTILRETGAGPHLRTEDGIPEERGGGEHDHEQGVFEIRGRRPPSRYAARMDELRHRPDQVDSGGGRHIAQSGEHKPSHKARMTPVPERLEDALEEHRTVHVFRVLEPPDEVRLQAGERPSGDGAHQSLPTAEVMEDGGMGDAHVRGDVLKPQGVGASGKKAPLGRVEYGASGFFCRPPAPGCPFLAWFRRSRT